MAFMEEKEFQALIKLLDDEDPRVGTHVEEKLLSMGDEVIPRLEAAWESIEDEMVQNRIEDIISVIQRQRATDELKAWFHEENHSLFDGWFYITRFQYPELDYTTFANAVKRLVHRTWLEFSPGMNTPQRLKMINRMLFQRERYRANRSKPLEPSNYYLNGLIETKKGGPVSLGLLYLILCEELKLPVSGLPIPGHFILICEDERATFYLDPVNKGTFFTKNDLERYLKEVNANKSAEDYPKVDAKGVMFELIKTLIICYQRGEKAEPDKARAWEQLLKELGYSL